MARTEELSVAELHELLICDAEAGKLRWKPRTPDMFEGKYPLRACAVWNAHFSGKEALNGVTKFGYKRGRLRWKAYMAHRVMWAMHTGAWPEHEIDHINGDRSDNRIANLRPATKAENLQNQKRYANNTSGYTGVHFSARSGKWIATICINRTKVVLGHYRSPEAASSAYADAKARLHTFHPIVPNR